MSSSPLSNRTLWAIALLVTFLWGVNFVVIAVGLEDVPPLILAGLRFVLAAVPAVFFVKRPAVSWSKLIGYGLLLGVGQFGLLFTAIHQGAPAGLSSVILQVQAFFTVFLAAFFLREKLGLRQLVGVVVAAGGLALLAWIKTPAGTNLVPLVALGLLVGAAFFWAAANVLTKTMGSVDALGLVVWSSLVPPIPLLALSWVLEGPTALMSFASHLTWKGIGSLAYLAYFSTLVGYGLWNYLIVRRGASSVAPFSLLVPIFGVTSAWLFLGEALTLVHWAAALLILAGLALMVIGGHQVKRRSASGQENSNEGNERGDGVEGIKPSGQPSRRD